jgi:hypothetical protein
MRFLSLSLILAALLPTFAFAQTQQSTSPDVILNVSGCNNNGICEPIFGEDQNSCPLDCSGSTTTPPVNPPTPGTPGTGSGGPGQLLPALYIKSIKLEQNQTSVTVTYETSNNTISTLFWGSLPDFEIGSIGGAVYQAVHIVKIENLLPGTRYYLRIQAKDLYGQVLSYGAGFTTAPITTNVGPANPRDVAVESQQQGLVITWTNPNSPGFLGVRVVRSPYHYPRDPNDGKIIYEGNGHYAVDPEGNGKTPYYYTLFSYDDKGNFSSGVIVRNPIKGSGELPGTVVLPGSTSLGFSTVMFIQEGKLLPMTYSRVTADSRFQLITLLPYQKELANVKDVYLILETPSGTSRYLLRYNQTDQAFEAELDLGSYLEGVYPVTVIANTILDKQYVFSGELAVQTPHQVEQGTGISFWPLVILFGACLLIIIIFLCILRLLIILLLKKREKEKKE